MAIIKGEVDFQNIISKQLKDTREYAKLNEESDDQLKARFQLLSNLKTELEGEKRTHNYSWVPSLFAPKEIQAYLIMERQIDICIDRILFVRQEKAQTRSKEERGKNREKELGDRNAEWIELIRRNFEPEGFANQLRANIRNGASIPVS